MTLQLFVLDPLSNIINAEIFLQDLELIENIEEMFPWYYVDRVILSTD